MSNARNLANLLNTDTKIETADITYPLTNFSSTGIDDNADATAITIDSSERVGIGNTTPDGGKLHVTNSTGAIGYFQSTQSASNVENIILNSTQTNSSSNLSFQINDGTTAKGQVRLNGDNSIAVHNTTSLTERMRIHSDGKVSIGTASANANLHIQGTSGDDAVIVGNSAEATQFRITVFHDDQVLLSSRDGDTARHIAFRTGTSEKMRIQDNGNFMVGTTNQSPAEGTTTGTRIGNNGATQFSASGQTSVIINRVQDGRIVALHSAGTLEGEIGISGSTTVYGAFTGTHWSRLKDNSKPTILKGTVLETIDEMCDWYQVQFEVDGSTHKASYKLQDGEKVGDTITYSYKQDGVEDDIDYQAEIIKEDDDKHTKCKISDTADSNSVYGVFCAWDSDDDTVNDMKVASLGTHVVRVNSSSTVSKGDLLVSNGDGTAKVQDDDIIRSKTIGKVLTNLKQETFSDGSYTVPCALYCG